MCAANRAHRLAVTGTDAQLAAKLRDAGYAVTRPKRASPDHWRLSLQRADLGELLTESEMIAARTGARVRLLGAVGTSAAGSAGVSLPLMPASAVRPGMVLATEDGGHDTVVSVEPIELDRPVFDLDIERTHNFIANGIVTHNCIYSWRGAQPRNILAFGERFPAHARIVLGRNFRCRSEILDPAVACVAHNVQREAKALIAMRGGGGEVRVIAYGSDRHEADTVAAAIGQALAPRHPRRARCWCSRAPGTRPGRCRPRSPGPGSRTECSAASACTSAPRSATRSPISRCSPTPPTPRHSAAPSAHPNAVSAPRPPTG